MNATNSSSNVLLQNCRQTWPEEVCQFANLCGLVSAGIWFLVLVPQVIRDFRFRTVEGLSLGWAIANFTAALNNAFFVFYLESLPLYSKISAAYMPVLELLLLLQFLAFTPHTKFKFGFAAVLTVLWVILIIVQSLFTIYSEMEWLSITLWSIETFPQVLLNMRRGTTHGMSLIMVSLTTVGKTTDFLSTYLLIIPLQYVIMAYFSSTLAFVNTLQVIFYWNVRPRAIRNEEEGGNNEDEPNGYGPLIRKDVSPSCNFVRWTIFTILSGMIACFAVGIVWGTNTWWAVCAPIGTSLILIGFYFFFKSPIYQQIVRHYPRLVPA